jgi:hypothetical protein
MAPLLFLLACTSPGEPDDSSRPTDDDSDTEVDDSTPPDDSIPTDDTSDDTGTKPPPDPVWSCALESTHLDMNGAVGAWSDPALGDGLVVDMAGAIHGWTGSGWQTIDSLDGPGRAIDGGSDGTVWVVGVASDARVREDGTWRSEPLPTIVGASPIDVSVTNATDVVVLWTGFDPKCATCEVNYVTVWDGTGFTTVGDPNDGTAEALAIESLSDGRHAIVGDVGYARVLEHGVWSDIDTKATTDTLFDIAEVAEGTLVATGENGILFVGSPELGLVPFDTKWYGDFVAIRADGTGGAWLLGSPFTTTRTDVVLLHWTGGVVTELPGEGTWYNLAEGPSGELLVLGGEEASAIAIGSDAGIAPTWRVSAIAPLADLALATDGTIYSTADRARGAVFGRYEAAWNPIDLGGALVLDEVEALSSGSVLFLATEDVWRWDGGIATQELLPVGDDPSWVGLVAHGDRAFVAGWAYDDKEERHLALLVRDELGWTPADVSALPGIAFFSLAVDEDGTVWLGGFDQHEGYLASWTETDGAQVVLSGLQSAPFGMWPKEDGGLWVLLDGDPEDRGFYSFDGATLALELDDLSSFTGVRDVAVHPDIGVLAAVGRSDDSSALLVRAADGAWAPVIGVPDAIASLAILSDGTILAGTTTGALTLRDCQYE